MVLDIIFIFENKQGESSLFFDSGSLCVYLIAGIWNVTVKVNKSLSGWNVFKWDVFIQDIYIDNCVIFIRSVNPDPDFEKLGFGYYVKWRNPCEYNKNIGDVVW
ncbi:hypothetical protein AVEN_186187-1 [Araneus ventricosus]|uniref:Uncharacterized protein n=1 Tax=Araneus ventricosus TaxID=182803 RepID=A0A4Y2GE75_ARAVE|nr:hypothetical protein AVEN_186187-1 [Araneus ventricosus]